MTPAEYEELVRDLVASIPSVVGYSTATRISYGANSHVIGASGHPHQIDVVIEDATTLVLIECKWYSRRVNVGTLSAHLGRMVDIAEAYPNKKVIAVVATKVGYQPGAEQVATHHNIELWAVRSAYEFQLRYGQLRAVSLGARANITAPLHKPDE